MLDLDQMKQSWATQDRMLDESMRLNKELLRAVTLQKTTSALRRMAAWLGLEAAVWLAIVCSLGSFIFQHLGIPRLSLSGAALDLYAIGMLAATIRQIVATRQIDYSRPIAAIQKQLELLRILRIRITQRALLAGTIVWAPCVIVVGRSFFGLDVNNAPWLWANVVFGLCLIPAGLWSSKVFGPRMSRFPLLQRVMKDISGYNLNAATAFLSELSLFQADSSR